jgi:copper chaperone
MELAFEVQNIKCGGCARSIERALGQVPGVERVAVEVDAGRVSVSAATDVREPVRAALAKLGYPESGAARGLDAMGARAKSLLSCAIGRFSVQDKGA